MIAEKMETYALIAKELNLKQYDYKNTMTQKAIISLKIAA